MENTIQKKPKMKLWKKILIGMLILVFILVASFLFMFRNEIKTMSSLTKLNDYPMYTMTYEGDYYFDDYLLEGASSDAEVLEYFLDKILRGLDVDVKLPDLANGCSTFNSITPEGDYVFSRNFDLDYSPTTIVHTQPDDGYKSVSTVNLSFMGFSEGYMPDDSLMGRMIMLAAPYVPIDGMNEKGLSVGILLIRDMDVTAQDTGKIDLQTTTAVRMMLDKAATVEEAVELLSQYDMHSSAGSTYHFQIADATGASVVVEYVDNVMSTIYPTEEFYQALTNFIVTPGDYYNHGRGQDRYEIIMTELDDNNGVLTEQECMDLLEAVKQDTQWSVVYNQTDLTGTISVNMDYDNLTEFTLTETIIE